VNKETHPVPIKILPLQSSEKFCVLESVQ
jgi:hypothetical protein